MSVSTIQNTDFHLTQPELLFMLRLLKLPDLPGMGPKPWGEIDLATAEQEFHDAGLAVHERGWAKVDENRQPVVEKELEHVLGFSAYPHQMVSMAYKHASGPATKHYYYRREGLNIRHSISPELIHEFQASAYSDMGQADMLSVFEGYEWDRTSPVVKIPNPVYDSSVEAAKINVEQSEKMLIEAGVDQEYASKISAIFAGYDLKMNAQWVYELNPQIIMNSATFWVNKKNCWVAQTAYQLQNDMINMVAVDHDLLNKIVSLAFKPFDNAN